MTQSGGGSSILELQRSAVLKMLHIGGGEQQSWGGSQTWKVLVFDNFCKEVVAPLLKIGGLRNHGVTLHLNIENDRQPVTDVPAVYFLEPTEKNIQRILEDLEKGLYESCYINFASSVTRPLLEDLAKGSLQSKAAQKVAGVFDRYVSFVSLSSSLFTLNLPMAYTSLNSPSSSDQFIEQYLERIVDGLLSVLVTMRSLPIIRCPPGSNSPMAEMVANRLESRIRELLSSGGPQAAELFSAERSPAAADMGASATNQRPLLCILDRDVDLPTMLHHTWTYQAMTHDIFGMRLNKLTVPVEGGGDSAAPPKSKNYDVDESDTFWTQHAGEPFPDVANAVHQAIEDYKQKSASMSAGPGEEDPTDTLAPGLAAAINALPEMTEKKRSIDMHTNIATALLSEIKARELDRYYELEEQFTSQSVSTSIKAMEELLADSQRGTLLDKTRALMCLYLSKQSSLTTAQVQSLCEALGNAGGSTEGIAFLQHLFSIRSMQMPGLQANVTSAQNASSGAGLMGSIGRFADGMRATSEGMFAAGMKGLKTIVASQKETPVCQIMDGLMEQKTTGITENYSYFDPKAPPSPPGGEAPRIRAPFRRGIAFVIGGGNYTEMQSLQEWGQKHGRQVCYGSTDMVAPIQFVEELCNLGKSLNTDMR